MDETRRRVLPTLAAFLGLFVLMAAFAYASLPSPSHLQDFGAFVASAQAQRLGINPYGTYLSLPERPDIRSNSPNANPPLSLVFFQPLSAMEPSLARWGWYVVTIFLHGLTLWLLHRAYPQQATPLRLFWGATILPFWFSLYMGQLYTLVALLVVGAWLLLRDSRTLVVGVLIGVVVSVKPQFVVWPAMLLFAGYWPITLTAAAVAIPLSLLPLVLFGPSIYVQWVAALGTDGASFAQQNNCSLIGLGSLVGMPSVGAGVAALLLVGLAVWAWRSHPSPLHTSRVAIIATLLASPLAWFGYSLILLPLFFERPWSFPLRLAGLTFLVPLPVGPGYTVALLVLLASLYWPLMAKPGYSDSTSPVV